MIDEVYKLVTFNIEKMSFPHFGNKFVMWKFDYILYNVSVKGYFLCFFNILLTQEMSHKIKKTGTQPCTCEFPNKL